MTIIPGLMPENGGSATGTVTRNNTDISQSLVVILSSNDTSEATVPVSVTIPANQASMTFTISAVDDSLLDGTQIATITASAAGYASGSNTVDVTDHETLTVTISPGSMSENGGSATGTVARSNTDITQSLVVTLSSDNTSEATVPATVTIPANQASATFTITAVDDNLLDGTQIVTISGSAPGYTLGSKAIDVTDLEQAPVITSADQFLIAENSGGRNDYCNRCRLAAARVAVFDYRRCRSGSFFDQHADGCIVIR